MFGLFKKKSRGYAVDFNAIGVDIHSHLIPGVDDGSKDLEDSIKLIKGLVNLGFKKIITTPHVYWDYYPNSSDRLLAGLDTLRKGLSTAGVNIEVECAAEYFMDEKFEELLSNKDLLTFGDNYVLVEMSFFSEPFKLNDYLFKLQTGSYKPILAHPERYTYYLRNFERLVELKERGFRLQLNLLSLTGHYGKEVEKLAKMLLDKNMYDFAGTDTHNLGHVDKLRSLLIEEKSKKTILGEGFSNRKFL